MVAPAGAAPTTSAAGGDEPAEHQGPGHDESPTAKPTPCRHRHPLGQCTVVTSRCRPTEVARMRLDGVAARARLMGADHAVLCTTHEVAASMPCPCVSRSPGTSWPSRWTPSSPRSHRAWSGCATSSAIRCGPVVRTLGRAGLVAAVVGTGGDDPLVHRRCREGRARRAVARQTPAVREGAVRGAADLPDRRHHRVVGRLGRARRSRSGRRVHRGWPPAVVRRRGGLGAHADHALAAGVAGLAEAVVDAGIR